MSLDIRIFAKKNLYLYVQEGRESATSRISSLKRIEFPIPVGIWHIFYSNWLKTS